MIKKLSNITLAILVGLGFNQAIFAGPSDAITLTCTTNCNTAVNTAFATLQTQVNSQIASSLPDVGKTFVENTAGANTFAARGITADYANVIDLFSVGVGVGVATSPFPPETSASNLSGAALSQSLALGLKLSAIGLTLPDIGPLKLSQSIGYFNVFGGSFDFDPLSASFFTLGAHISAPIIEPASFGLGLFSWGGVNLISGFDYNTVEITASQALSETQGTSSFSGTGVFGAKASTFTIPVEVATNLRLFWIFTAFGGLGVDFNFGSAESIARIDDGVVQDSLANASGTATLDLGESSGPSFLAIRGFGGVQMSLGPIAFFAQYNQGLTESVSGVTGGARLVW
jgi:hypothetical protein